jgi:hypothetical protein
MTAIDYAADHNKMRYAGAGRTDPCPDGRDARPAKQLTTC